MSERPPPNEGRASICEIEAEEGLTEDYTPNLPSGSHRVNLRLRRERFKCGPMRCPLCGSIMQETAPASGLTPTPCNGDRPRAGRVSRLIFNGGSGGRARDERIRFRFAAGR